MDYTPYSQNISKLHNSLAEVQPKTLATMHGSAFHGDCRKALIELNLVMKEIWDFEQYM